MFKLANLRCLEVEASFRTDSLLLFPRDIPNKFFLSLNFYDVKATELSLMVPCRLLPNGEQRKKDSAEFGFGNIENIYNKGERESEEQKAKRNRRIGVDREGNTWRREKGGERKRDTVVFEAPKVSTCISYDRLIAVDFYLLQKSKVCGDRCV